MFDPHEATPQQRMLATEILGAILKIVRREPSPLRVHERTVQLATIFEDAIAHRTTHDYARHQAQAVLAEVLGIRDAMGVQTVHPVEGEVTIQHERPHVQGGQPCWCSPHGVGRVCTCGLPGCTYCRFATLHGV